MSGQPLKENLGGKPKKKKKRERPSLIGHYVSLLHRAKLRTFGNTEG